MYRAGGECANGQIGHRDAETSWRQTRLCGHGLIIGTPTGYAQALAKFWPSACPLATEIRRDLELSTTAGPLDRLCSSHQRLTRSSTGRGDDDFFNGSRLVLKPLAGAIPWLVGIRRSKRE